MGVRVPTFLILAPVGPAHGTRKRHDASVSGALHKPETRTLALRSLAWKAIHSEVVSLQRRGGALRVAQRTLGSPATR